MRFPTRLLVAVLVAAPVLLAASASAQTVLRPGHPDLVTEGLSLDSQILVYRPTGDPAQDLGTVSYTFVEAGDRVTMTTASDGSALDIAGGVTSEFAWPSLQPVRSERGTKSRIEYDGTHITGVYGRGDWDPLPFDITTETSTFQPEVLPLVARALPLRQGYTATVPTFSAGTRRRDYTLTVVGQKPVTRADGSTVQAWVVDETSTQFGGRARRYFVDPATRALIQKTFEPQEGATVVAGLTTQSELDAAEAARAQVPPLRPGASVLAMDALQSYSQDYVVKVVQPVQQDAGTQSRTVTVDRDAGTVTIQSEVEIAIAGQKSSETVVAAYPSLRPISSRSDNNGVVTELVYSETGVARTRIPADPESEDYTMEFDEPVFDSSFLFEVIRLLPFEEDYQAAFQTFSTDGPTAVMLTVTGQDEIDGRSVWTVRAQPDEGPPTTFSIDAETRALARIEIQPQVGVVVYFVPTEG